MLAPSFDRLVSAGLDRAVAHVAWHAVFTVAVGSVLQEQARNADREPTFEAVSDIYDDRADCRSPATSVATCDRPAQRTHAGTRPRRHRRPPPVSCHATPDELTGPPT